MNLNKRVSLLILPVLIVGYLVAFIGVYSSQKETLLELEKRSLDLQVTELNALFSSYKSVTNSFIESLLYSNSLHNYLTIEDRMFQALSLEKGLENAIRDLNALKSEFMSVGLITASGKLEYYFENSADPFAVMTEDQKNLVAKAFEDQKHEVSEYLYDSERTYITRIRVIDKRTFKEPINYKSESGLAIIVAVEPTSFNLKVKELQASGVIVSFYKDSEPHTLADAGSIVSSRNLGVGVEISLEIPRAMLALKLDKIIYSLILSFVVIAIPTYFLLILLITRYITGPIRRLRRQLMVVDFESGKGFQASPAQDEIGAVSRAFGKLYEKLEQSYRLTKDLAEKDSLTKLYNRRIFNMLVSKSIQRSKIDNKKAALFYLDIDNFKFVNDTYGHGTGDALLLAFSERLQGVLRAGDQVVSSPLGDTAGTARLAGDEFAVILSDLPDEQQAHWLAQRMLDICLDGFSFNDALFPISLSIGVAIYPLDGGSTEELITNADAAMYEAKQAGKNRYCFYSESMAERSRRVSAIESSLKQLNYSELTLFYMPIIDARQPHKTLSVEALIRWNSSKLGQVSPDEFIPIAETIGCYERIDAWVIEQAFKDSKRIREHLGDIRLNINISSAQLSSRTFIEMLQALTRQYDVNPQNFELEITETFNRNKSSRNSTLLSDIKALGFHLALDDFGTGFTSIMQLVDYPVDTIKVDRDFTALLSDQSKQQKALSMIEFCVSQGFQVTVEGVETESQFMMLQQSGCQSMQGFYFAKPMPLENLLARDAQ